MPYDFVAIGQEAKKEITGADSLEGLESLRIKYLGRRGLLAKITASIPSVPVNERPEIGRNANLLKQKLNQLLEGKVAQLKEKKASVLEKFDVTLPGIVPQRGAYHPITQTIQEISSIFSRVGFVVVEGPEVETEYNNFTGLNIPLEHPSRDAFDTFYIKSQVTPTLRSGQAGHPDASVGAGRSQVGACERLLLRSHTSPAQIRVMKKYKPPLAVIVPGKVYRPDAIDASHSFMFHQIEGFLVDENVRFSDLKGILAAFVKGLFGEDTKMRFRPHFFPFTEPSAEVDISCIICKGHRSEVRSQKSQRCSVCGGKGWLEVLGCGMIHPNVFSNVGYPKDKYTGFAFGMGVDRIAMLKYNINDIRLFYENDLRFLKQF
jgi:phenylalanyl-tRNA synthetase alpha chain